MTDPEDDKLAVAVIATLLQRLGPKRTLETLADVLTRQGYNATANLIKVVAMHQGEKLG